MLTKVWARRISPTLPTIINVDQIGFIKSRFIGEHIRLIEDILAYTDQEKINGILLQLDFEKAFHSKRPIKVQFWIKLESMDKTMLYRYL